MLVIAVILCFGVVFGLLKGGLGLGLVRFGWLVWISCACVYGCWV